MDLKIGGLENLSYLDCNTNSLTAIDTNTNPALTYYNCASNVIKALDVSNNTKLEKLYCHSCRLLTSLNIKNCGNLTALYLISSSSNCVSQSTISVKNSSLQSLVLGGYAKWTKADISSNAYLKAVDLSELPTLITLNCTDNAQLTSLNTNKCYAIKYVDCSSNILSALDLSTNRALQTLDCFANNLTALDLSNNVALQTINCYENQLKNLDVNNCLSLNDLDCHSNQLPTLLISNCSELKSLKCYDNQLNELEVINNQKLTYLDCRGNSITEINISKNINLDYFYCSNTTMPITSVNGILKIGYCINIDGNNGIIYELAENHHGKAISINESGRMEWVDGVEEWCEQLGAAWKLPSKEELLQVYYNKNILNQSLQKVGYPLLSGSYWAAADSTDITYHYAFSVSFDSGYVRHISAAGHSENTRAVCEF